jgi:hypothetical protein
MSLQTDAGSEFKKEFSSYLFQNNILHNTTLPGRHKQNSNVESLNRQIGRLLNGYMNKMEVETGETYVEWTKILPDVIKKLNAYKKQKRGSLSKADNPYVFNSTTNLPKFKIGDMVHEKLDRPENALGYKQTTENFREGDYRYSSVSKRIVKVIVMNDTPYYRYMLNGIPNASYTENELFLSQDKVERQVVKKIIGKRKNGKLIEYQIWWKGELKKMASWEPKKNLVEDGLSDMIDAYDQQN